MTVEILGIFDITDRVLDIGTSDALFSPAGYTPARRTFVCADNDNFLGPISGGILDTDNNGWRNAPVVVTDDDGNITFQGILQTCRQREDERQGIVTELEAVSGLGAVAGYPIEENTKLYGSLTGAHGKGTTNVVVSNLTGTVGSVAVMTLEADLEPSYIIQSATGTNPVTFRIEPGLDADAASGLPVLVSVPIFGTPAALLKRAFQTALAFIGRPDLLDEASFDTLDNEQSALGLSLQVFVRLPDNLSLGDYVAAIIRATGLFVSEDTNGTISLFNGPGWDGVNPLETISDDIIIRAPVDLNYADSDNPLVYGYNCLYPIGENVVNQSRALATDDPTVLRYGATDVLTPIQLAGGAISAYRILYADQPTAEYYGEQMLSYYSINRRRVGCSVVLKDVDLNQLNLRQFQNVLLTMGYGMNLTNEPARVMSFTKNEAENRIDSLVLELCNKDWPGLPT